MKDFDIERISELAMLTLTSEEKETLTKDMADIVAFASRVAEAAEDGFEAAKPDGIMRADEAMPSLSRDKALAAAPAMQDGCFLVPKVVE